MALYQDATRVQKTTHSAFDQTFKPGVKAQWAGIYRCIVCDHEIGIALGHDLPPQGHQQHPPHAGPIEWQLLVYAVHKK